MLTDNTPQKCADCNRAKVARGGDLRDVAINIFRKEPSVGSPRTDLGLESQSTFEEYCREGAGPIDAKQLNAMAESGTIHVVYARIRFERDAAFRAFIKTMVAAEVMVCRSAR